ncbi:MAG: hypothetical protein JKY93_10745 [Gammaproteobacteria bacterium]|nr:hypothetical protein [Gammaproteobacteria bacterium]
MRWFLASLLSFQLVACSSGQPAIAVWDNEAVGVFSAEFSASGRYLVIGTIGGEIKLFDVQQQKLLYTWTHQNTNHAAMIATAFSPDESYVVTAEDQSVAMWSIASGEIVGYWEYPEVKSVSVASKGQFLMVGLGSYEAGLLDPRRHSFFHHFKHQDKVNVVAISPDGRFAVSGSNDGTAKLWDTDSGKLLKTIQHDYKVVKVVFSADSSKLLTNAARSESIITDTASLQTISSLGKDRMTLSAARFSKDGTMLLTGRPGTEMDLWQVASGKHIKSWMPNSKRFWRPPAATILSVVFQKGEKTFMSQSSEGLVETWSLD